MKLILLFIALQLINVILSTIKTLITIKGNRIATVLSNAIYYALYTVVVVFLSYDFALWIKIVVTFITNLIGVWFSMWLMEILRKDRLWEIVATVKLNVMDYYDLCCELDEKSIQYSATTLTNGGTRLNIYSYSKQESEKIKPTLKEYNAKYIVHEESVKL